MDKFSYITAASIFATYVVIDMLYAWYIMSVNKKRALTAAFLTAIIYSLLAFGVVSYSKNIYYLIPLASGAFTGTYLMVRFKE
jgi:uncharacterized BrkB/YihY/UPF0761 family membrane protein